MTVTILPVGDEPIIEHHATIKSTQDPDEVVVSSPNGYLEVDLNECEVRLTKEIDNA